jgi:glycosyltransferase involved in cell wall biosynthesis
MLNIISLSILSNRVSGPKKVVENLIKGLEKLHYPYVINKRLDSCKRLWIHDDTDALREAVFLPADIKVVVGPNLGRYILPRHIPDEIDLSRMVYLLPSKWTKEFWLDFGFKRCPIEVWPVGIDIDEFNFLPKEKKYVLLYLKQRSLDELRIVEEVLKRKNIIYRILRYPEYKERDYKEMLSETRYAVWLGRQESQGIALQEALAANVPVLVCDVSYVGHWVASKREMGIFNKEENEYRNTTSAPYFDNSCGIKIKDLNCLSEAVDYMERNWQGFSPRDYILKNFNLEKQARELLTIYEKYFNLSYTDGFREKMIKMGNWKNSFLRYKLLIATKDLAKKFREICFKKYC